MADYRPNGRSPGRNCSKERALIAADPDVGKISDVDLANRYGVSRFVSASVRNELKIPPCPQAHRRDTPVQDALTKYHKWMGVYFDTHIARELRVAVRSIQKYRRQHKISPGKKPLPNIVNQFLYTWKRPKGIDALLEQINE